MNRDLFWRLAAMPSLLLLFLLITHNVVPCEARELRVVALLPFSGGTSQLGIRMNRTLTLFSIPEARQQLSLTGDTLNISIVDSGSYTSARVVNSALTSAPGSCIPSGSDVHAFVAPYGSTADQKLSYLASALKIPVISSSATSVEFADRTLHPYFVRTVSSDSLLADALMAMCRRFGWRRLAVLAFQDSYGVSMTKRLLELQTTSGVNVLLKNIHTNAALALQDYKDAFQEFEETGYRIIVVHGSGDPSLSNLALDVAISMDLMHKEFVMIGTSRWVNKFYFMSYSQAVNTTTGALLHDMSKLKGLLGVTLEPDFLEGTQAVSDPELTQHNPIFDRLNETFFNATKALATPKTKAYTLSATYVEAAIHDALMLAVNAFQRLNALSKTWTADNFMSVMPALAFDGATGRVRFNAQGDFVGHFAIMNFDGQEMQKRGVWRAADGCYHSVHDTVTTNASLEEEGYVWPNARTTPPLDRPLLQVFSYPEWLQAVMILFATILTATCVAVAGVLLWYRSANVVRAASIVFCIILLLGVTACGWSSVLFVMDVTSDAMCRARLAVFPLAMCLTLIPLLLKTYRIMRVFTLEKLRVVSMPDSWLLIRFGTLLCAPLAILVPIFLVDHTTPVREQRVLENGSVYSQSQLIWECTVVWEAGAPLMVLLGLLILVSLAFAWRVRGTPSAFNESSHIMTVILFIAAYALLVLPIQFLLESNPLAVAVLRGVGMLLGSFIIVGVLFIPKLLVLFGKSKVTAFERERESLPGAKLTPTGTPTLSPQRPPTTRSPPGKSPRDTPNCKDVYLVKPPELPQLTLTGSFVHPTESRSDEPRPPLHPHAQTPTPVAPRSSPSITDGLSGLTQAAPSSINVSRISRSNSSSRD